MLIMKQYYLYLIFVTAYNFLQAHPVSGSLSWLANQEIRTESFKGLQSNAVASVKTDDKGNLSLPCYQSDYGMGYLISADEESFFIILNGEDVTLSGESSREPKSIAITNGQENLLFEEYAKGHRVRKQALKAWIYLKKIYIGNTFFSSNQKTTQSITKEKAQYQTKEIPATIAAFKSLDYTDKRIYKSGLFKDAISSQIF